MNRTLRLFSIICAASLIGCAASPSKAPDPGAAPGLTLSADKPATTKPSISSITHADLQAAAAYATANGYPARAAMWTAIEAQLTAAENQVKACKAAIEAALPKRSDTGIVGLATLTEMGAEAVAQGVPASVKANCEPIVLPAGLLPIPKL